MKNWTQIEELNAGDIALRSNGLKARPSEIKVLSIKVMGNYANMTWKWNSVTDHYYSTDFRKSTALIDFGSWCDLTSQQWKLETSEVN